MMDKSLLDAGCRVAFAALLHDQGKFAERAGMPNSCKVRALGLINGSKGQRFSACWLKGNTTEEQTT